MIHLELKLLIYLSSLLLIFILLLIAMLNLFNKKNISSTEATSYLLYVQLLPYSNIDFSKCIKGIDNVHIDVHLSPNFVNLTQRTVNDLVEERTTVKRRFTDKPSTTVRNKLEELSTSYASMITTVIHRVKEDKQIELVQLCEVATKKFILTTVQSKVDNLLYELRKAGTKEHQKSLALHDRIRWIHGNYNRLLYQVNSEVFAQLQWVETGEAKNLREALLGLSWTIPEEMLFNPLWRTPEIGDSQILMSHYVFLSPDSSNPLSFDLLNITVDNLLEEIAQTCGVVVQTSDYRSTDQNFCWKDVPENVDKIFNMPETLHHLENARDQNEELKLRLEGQRKANKLLQQGLQQRGLLEYIFAAYEIPRLYEHYAKLLQPSLLYQTLCNKVDIKEVEMKLQSQLKLRPLRRPGDEPLSINELIQTKKQLQRFVKNPDSNRLLCFLKDFVAYCRDLKYYHLMQEVMEEIHLIQGEVDVKLSRSNGLLYEFLEQDEYNSSSESIRCHVIVKADLRGSTTMTAELCKRGLNPATHFGRNFFNPIRQLLEKFGAEKVFIEGDAVILSIFEYQNAPEQWVATARACGLAKHMLEVVHTQNQVSRTYHLPELELGIGICYCSEAPKFLYDGNQRIMISPAIGDADRLSSCSWKLRRKYSQDRNLLTHVMVFRQPSTDTSHGEKGMTTFRYNLNGIELDIEAFKKLQKEMAFRQFKMTLPGEKYETNFYIGNYPDMLGETHQVVIREARILLWQENSDYYPPTDDFYYEVVVNKTLLTTIKRLLQNSISNVR